MIALPLLLSTLVDSTHVILDLSLSLIHGNACIFEFHIKEIDEAIMKRITKQKNWNTLNCSYQKTYVHVRIDVYIRAGDMRDSSDYI